MFYFGTAGARNRLKNFKICCAISPTQKRQNCLISVWRRKEVRIFGYDSGWHLRGPEAPWRGNVSSVRWQLVETSHDVRDQQ